MANLPADLPARLKRWGLEVDIVHGWETRGRPSTFRPRGVVLHHTGTKARPGVEWPTYSVLLNGRSDLAGPLCNFGLSATGRVLLVAAGTANHAGAGGWEGMVGNAEVVGIEAENDGGSPWPTVQLDAYDRLTACVLETIRAGSSMACAHFEWAPRRKNDPHGFDMPALRSRVGHLLAHPPGTAKPQTKPQGDPMLCAILDHVERRYREIAGRAPDGPGRQAWVAAFHAAETDADVASRPARVIAVDDRLVAGLSAEKGRG